jgi:hypothetical protein
MSIFVSMCVCVYRTRLDFIVSQLSCFGSGAVEENGVAASDGTQAV